MKTDLAQLTYIDGGVVAPMGFRSSGAHCQIKRKRNDIGLIVSDVDCVATGVFTQNVVKASCVELNQQRIGNPIRAIVANSGNANACNGEQGMADAKRFAQFVADGLGAPADSILSASTGVIGVALPMDKIERGVAAALLGLQSETSAAVSEGIMTTDTYPKEVAVEIALSGDRKVRIGAIAKGSGMIAPNMATMLCFITTDAVIDRDVLHAMLSRSAWYTFNSITVDGDTSTNDMVLVIANGMASNKPIVSLDSADAALFETALYNICLHLAKEIARDGEGATKLVSVTVRSVAPPQGLVEAFDASDKVLSAEQRASFARSVAKTIANSSLVKTALFGNDPNWGRILAAAGRSGVSFDPATVEITLAGHKVYANGRPTQFNGYVVSEAMNSKEIDVLIDFHQAGGHDATVYTCDLTYDYVKINAEYHT
jgi:glutamate N-acetyltransferase/amino-acid N-acetyltransferase